MLETLGVLIIKIILVILSVITVGLLPLLSLLNQWIWNEIIVKNVFICAKPITSLWIVMGLTAVGGIPLLSFTRFIINIFKK